MFRNYVVPAVKGLIYTLVLYPVDGVVNGMVRSVPYSECSDAATGLVNWCH